MRCHKLAAVFVLGLLLSSQPVLIAQLEQAINPKTPEIKKVKHDRGIDDIQAIGNRKIGGGGVGNWYSMEHEIGLGREYSREIEVSVRLLADPVVTEYVNRLAQNLVRNSDAKVPFTVKVIDSDEVNAFALPGGFLYVNSGLILASQDEAELAGVMAHEIAHVAARHATRQLTRSQMFNLASIPLIFVGGGLGVAVRQVAGLAIPLSLTKFSRGFEAEADYLGVEYLYKSGYDPQAFISFFERVQAEEKHKPGLIAKAFADHPQTADRVKKTQREIAGILPPRDAYIVSTSDFEEVRSRLIAIGNRHRTGASTEEGPVLRRKTDDSSKDNDNDERPTLKRRGD